MRAARHVSRVRQHHGRLRGDGELNIVPLIDMMVVLLFFLIFTAVFSRVSILELNLPSANAELPVLPQGLQLEVIVQDEFIEVADRHAGMLKHLPRVAAGHDLEGLGDYLRLVKTQYPGQQDASILLAPAISYDVLVQVMDAVRVYELPGSLGWARAELFPNISVGDAPT
ncbi:MAG: biopolymer transporter ExbD [Gammaproteobacteria bacterium]|nr:biopolymer transporter ExbD [Gammaproteobacteria bacterium]